MNASFDAGNMQPGSASVTKLTESDDTRICRKGLKESSFIPLARKLSGSEETGGAADICKSSKKQRTVSFAPDYQVIQLDDDQTEDLKSLLGTQDMISWYSRMRLVCAVKLYERVPPKDPSITNLTTFLDLRR